MSVLETISIQGIRSFDPRNPQVLNFFKPVTLILGQNGTGKTTIIECLKYATTGDLPPGSKVGGSFVHDPKIAGESEVKAKVSLQLKNLKGEPMTISRALQATQKNKQISMQTLDSSIQRRGANGNDISISSKCGDINIEMTNSLGVSKAVLENVIFCHQEDSNWPLAEGKAVKERFDDLFASARYVKALDSIRKIKQEKESNLKTHKVELGHLKNQVDYINKKLADKTSLESKASEFDLKCTSTRERLKPIEESILKYQRQYTELCEIQKKRDIFMNEKRSTETRIRELKENISEEIHYSTEELEQLIGDSDSHLTTLRNSIAEEERRRTNLGNDVLVWQKEHQSLLLDKGAVNSKIEANNNLEKEFNASIRHLVDELGLPYDESCPSLMIGNLYESVTALESARDQDLKIYDEKLNVHYNELELKKSEKTKLEHEIEINRKNLRAKNTELSSFEKKIASIGEDTQKLDFVKEELIGLHADLEAHKDSFDSNSVHQDIEQFSKNVSLLEDQLSQTDNVITKYQNEEAIHNAIKVQEQQKAEKSSSSKRLRSRHMESLEKIFNNSVPEKNLKRLLDQKLNEMRNKSAASQQSNSNLQYTLATLNTQLKQIRDRINENQKVVKRFEEDVFDICGSFQLGNSLAEFREKKRKLEEESLAIQSGISLYTKFQELLSKNKSDCPLCHREFKHDSEVNDLIEEINDKCASVPIKLDNISKEMATVNNKIESIIKLESQADKIRRLKESVLDELESQSESKKRNISEVQQSLAQLTTEQESCANDEKLASSILGDVANMEKYNDEVTEIDRNLNNLRLRITHSPEEFSEKYQAAQSEKKSIQNELLSVKKQLESKRKYYQDSMKKENNLTTKINNLESEKLKIEKVLQEVSSCHLQKEALRTDIVIIESQIQVSMGRLQPVIDDLSSLRNTYSRVDGEKKSAESTANKKIVDLRSRVDAIKRTSQAVNKSKQEKANERLETIENRIAGLFDKIQLNIESQRERNLIIEELNSKIGNNQIRQRELQDTLKIRQHNVTIVTLEASIKSLEDQLGGISLANIPKELNKLDSDRRILKDEIEKSESQRIKITTEIDIIERDLSSDRNKNANKLFLDMAYQVKTSELAIFDLEKYYKALDKAILSYHRAKMAEINKILKEMWRNTYSGKDIDYLEICSDEDTSSAGSKKRNYNYRVVMIKSNHGARLDMRGRCSAGQKVLASLLIRLALAEVFCLHCGVLALDEPTTNLDQENIENLAYALVEIIKTRSIQKNFQLIVITHDEDFVKLLGRSEYIDEFYKIHANSSGHSEIEVSGIDQGI